MREFNYIFGIGPGKSGTHSLWEALEFLGLSCLHMGNDKYKNNGVPVVASQINKNVKNKLPVLTGVPVRDAYLDYPLNAISPAVLDEQYPNSLFILTYRNPDAIALSWARMCLSFEDARHHPTNYEEKVNETRQLYTRALRFAERIPTRFLIIDTQIKGPTNMQKLTKFLDLPPNDKEWPHGFNHQEWYQNDHE